jgi:hypothetical protein
MTEILLQMALTLSLVVSAMLGELVSTKVFGTLKSAWLYIIDIILFVVVMVVVLNSIGVYEALIAVPLYFISGFLTIVSVRGLTTLMGFESAKLAEKGKISEVREEHYIKNLRRNLERYNMEEDEIEEVLLNSGFKKRLVQGEFRNRERNVP